MHARTAAPAGARKILDRIIECFLDTDFLSLAAFLEDRAPLAGKPVTTSSISRLLFACRCDCAYLPLMPCIRRCATRVGRAPAAHRFRRNAVTSQRVAESRSDQRVWAAIDVPVRFVWPCTRNAHRRCALRVRDHPRRTLKREHGWIASASIERRAVRGWSGIHRRWHASRGHNDLKQTLAGKDSGLLRRIVFDVGGTGCDGDSLQQAVAIRSSGADVLRMRSWTRTNLNS